MSTRDREAETLIQSVRNIPDKSSRNLFHLFVFNKESVFHLIVTTRWFLEIQLWGGSAELETLIENSSDLCPKNMSVWTCQWYCIAQLETQSPKQSDVLCECRCRCTVSWNASQLLLGSISLTLNSFSIWECHTFSSQIWWCVSRRNAKASMRTQMFSDITTEFST